MTDREKAIVMAYTGICMLEGDDLSAFYEYLNELYGRPVFTHEIVTLDVKERSKKDFLNLCRGHEKSIEERKTGEWIYDENGMDWNIPAWRCSNCGGRNDMIPISTQYKDGPRRVVNPYIWAGSKFCPNCGAKMGEVKDVQNKTS